MGSWTTYCTRYNPLRGNWVLVSPHRNKRPWQWVANIPPMRTAVSQLTSELLNRGQQETASEKSSPEYEASCYLCPGNKRAQGDVNPAYESPYAFINDYTAVKKHQEKIRCQKMMAVCATTFSGLLNIISLSFIPSLAGRSCHWKMLCHYVLTITQSHAC